jgi:murein DD-endopeptidase MepM/ murein hydrolase activator NlpD
LISYEIKDTAVSASSKSASSLLSQEAPTDIDPLTGTVVNQKTVDTIDDNSNPGSSLKALEGSQNVKDTRDSRARLARLYGLPSSFTVVMSPATVKVSPLDTLETVGFGGVLDRVWLVDRIVHNVSNNTTTFSLVSPIDVKDLSPAPTTSASTDVPKGFVGSGSWVYPTNGIVTSGYGNRNAPLDGASTNHRGTDIAGSRGFPIYAPANGVVTEARTIGKAGQVVRIDHGNGYVTEYFHCDSILTRPGLTVKQGDQIATQGTTGNSTGVHLHFGVKKDGSYINPAELFPLLGSKGTTIVGKTPA